MVELTIRLIFSLAVVVGLLLVATKLGSRRFRGSKVRRGAGVSVLHRQALSRTSSVAVVEVGNRVLVIGTTEHQVNLLTELGHDDLDESEEPVEAAPADQAEVAAAVVALEAAPPVVETRAARHVAAVPAPVPAPAPEGEVIGFGRRRATRSVDSTPADRPARVGGSHAARPAPTHAAPAPTPVAAPVPVAAHVAAPAPIPTQAPASVQPAAALSPAELLAAGAVDTTDFNHHLITALAAACDTAPAPAPAKAQAPRSGGRRKAAPPAAQPAGDGPLAGSILSPDTWRQALAATRRTG